MLPPVEAVIPPDDEIRAISGLRANLRRVDGWGPIAWKEILGAWRLPEGVLAITLPEFEAGDDEDERLVFLAVDHGLGEGDPVATADWILRHAAQTLLAKPAIRARTLRPGQAVRATNACWIDGGRLFLRLHVELPYAGMCIDTRRFGRFVKQVERFAADLATRRRRPELERHRRSLARTRALRAVLPGQGLVAFLADGSVLPRNRDGGPAERAIPLRTPVALRTEIDLGRFGKVRGWGVRAGVTAIAGAPYHGKSTVLQALQAGIDDHPPGDGRELVVTDPSALLVQAEDGRRIVEQDLSAFFHALPGADPKRFSTERASGATSMAASVLQGVAAGCQLLLVDEDTAASNFLLIDPVMRKLLGPTLGGTRTLLEALPALAEQGVSTVLVAGSSGHSLAVASRVVQMDHWQPHDVTARARRLVGRPADDLRHLAVPARLLTAGSDAVFGPRHFAPLDLREPERPRIKLPAPIGTSGWTTLDLRRCGWVLDEALVAGALLAAGWCCRLETRSLVDLQAAYAGFVARGPTAIDPFHSRMLTVPPWQLVVTVLERLGLAGGR